MAVSRTFKNQMSANEELSQILVYDDIECEDAFLRLAKQFGDPVLLSDGLYIKTLNVMEKIDAPANSLSARHGAGMFPFHTDTAFWSLPTRFVLLRAVGGDFGRSTYIKPFQKLLSGLRTNDVSHSAWVCNTGQQKFYTTLCFEKSGQLGYRYDPNCMVPANKAAKKVEKIIKPLCFEIKGLEIQWRRNRVAIIPNWTCLHARGPSISLDQTRTLERIYLK
jgi:L-asparagine oxygenase